MASSSNLPPMVGNTAVGSSADVKVLRDGKQVMLNVKIAELPKEEDIKMSSADSGDHESKSVSERRLGVAVATLTDAQRRDLDIKDPGGVVVTTVDDGPASQAGIHRGDIILKINGVDVKDVEHFNKLVADLPKDKSVLVQRRNGPLFLALKLDDTE